MQQPMPAPDLHTQFEALLDCVWRCEASERMLDRCDQAARLEEERARAKQRKERGL